MAIFAKSSEAAEQSYWAPFPSRRTAPPSPSASTAPSFHPPPSAQVNNYANEGAVNGPVVGTSEVADGPLTTATIPNKRRPSKLRVAISLGGGESFRPIQLGRGGDYWVVAAGQSVDPADRSGNLYGEWRAWGCAEAGEMPAVLCIHRQHAASYHPHLPPLPPSTHTPAADWAIVTGGRPNRRSNGACATGSPFGLVRRFQTNNVGLWLFTRKPIDPVNTQVSRAVVGWRLRGQLGSTAVPTEFWCCDRPLLPHNSNCNSTGLTLCPFALPPCPPMQLMMGKLAELGLDPSGLLDVQQQGCTYACGPGSGQCN